ncbi:hypothetical protein EV361DRAFT_578417 [Lentinula raphanica]|uniref:Uncharacterized protein n=1 Tax=Lentinula raphanica TaxID=153919 RepID=A0AA38PDX4_9AGAR|nr:hypothetical protein F5880DRAFT_1505329 [Lentinula raphanica]KAJ3841143.1 hypothetical protein F5878DRAFT_611075 [Lentinula raphanica]KAJ3974941.1 hypothetical protein EV361DRAFT_578417 [Lentinula raphanica]
MFIMRVIAHACLLLQLIVGFSAVAVYSLPAPVDDHGIHKPTTAPVDDPGIHKPTNAAVDVRAPVGSHGAHKCFRPPVQGHAGRVVLTRRAPGSSVYLAQVRILSVRSAELAYNQRQSREDVIQQYLEKHEGYGTVMVQIIEDSTGASPAPLHRFITFSATMFERLVTVDTAWWSDCDPVTAREVDANTVYEHDGF